MKLNIDSWNDYAKDSAIYTRDLESEIAEVKLAIENALSCRMYATAKEAKTYLSMLLKLKWQAEQ